MDPVPVRKWDCWVVCFVVKGELAPIFSDERKMPMQQEYVWLLPPSCAHGWHGGGEVLRHEIYVTEIPDTLKHAVETRGYIGRPISRKEIRKLVGIYERLKGLNKEVSLLCSLKVDKELVDLAMVLLEGMELAPLVPMAKMDEQRVEAVLAWYREHMSEFPSIEDAANFIGVSTTHLRRIFQRVHAKPPWEIFLQMRLERAKSLLVGTSQDVWQVGRQSGFRSDRYFCRVFRQYVGVSPSHLR